LRDFLDQEKTEKKGIEKELKEKNERERSEYSSQLKELKEKAEKAEAEVREMSNTVLTKEAAFDKEKALLDQRVQYQEQQIKQYEEASASHLGDVRKIESNLLNEKKEIEDQFTTQIEDLKKALEETEEKLNEKEQAFSLLTIEHQQ